MRSLIAVLASHNRCEKTLGCLRAFFSNSASDIRLSAVLLDDGSTDKTAERVKREFGDAVIVIPGDGSLYWNGGMRKAIETASKADPDFLLWLNDDTLIDGDALSKLLTTYTKLTGSLQEKIVIGAIRDIQSPSSITYGGLYRARWFQRTRWSRLPESSQIQDCETMNGNCVLISRSALMLVGNLSPDFTHSMGDLDYGLRAAELGCRLVVAPGTVGTCTRNSIQGTFDDRCLTLTARWRHLVSVKGLPPREWATFTQRHAGPFWLIYWAWPFARVAISALLSRRESR